MMNKDWYFPRMRSLIEEHESSRERALALTKLEECEMWLAKCKPSVEAAMRDQDEPSSLPRRRGRDGFTG